MLSLASKKYSVYAFQPYSQSSSGQQLSLSCLPMVNMAGNAKGDSSSSSSE